MGMKYSFNLNMIPVVRIHLSSGYVRFNVVSIFTSLHFLSQLPDNQARIWIAMKLILRDCNELKRFVETQSSAN